jgi:hypothetical protein
VVDARRFFTRCAAAAVICTVPAGAFAQSRGGLSSAQLARLHQLGIPIVGTGALPAGFRVTQANALPGNRSYRIVYANSAGASITFEGGQLSGGSGGAKPPPKQSFFKRLFGNVNKTVHPSSNGSSTTSNEAEGQGSAAIVADSTLIGPIRFVPSGQCLRGVADASKAQVHGAQFRVSGCNFDDPDPLINAYRHARRL